MQLLAPELLALQRETEKKIAAITAERDHILSRMKEAAKQAETDEDNARVVVPYMFPQATCSNCHKSYTKNRKGKRPLSINEMHWVKPRQNATSALLCPKCKLEILGKREKHSVAPPPLQIEFERNPYVWPFIKEVNEKTDPAATAGLHTAQAGNDAQAKHNRLEARRQQQAAQQTRLYRHAMQEIEMLKWVTENHSVDLVEAARATILDGTNAKVAEHDRKTVIKMTYEDMKKAYEEATGLKYKVPYPLLHRVKDAGGQARLVMGSAKACVHGVVLTETCSRCRSNRRFGKQHTWLKAEPGSSNSGPLDPSEKIAHIRDEHATNTVWHSELIGPKKAKDKGDAKVKTFEYTKTPMQVTATKVGEAVAKLYQAPAAKSLMTIQGEEMDLEGAADLPRQVQELLAVQNLTQYANEGCKMYVLSHRDQTYVMYVTASVDLQVYVVTFDGVFGWAVYQDSADPDVEFTFDIRRGREDEAFVTVTLKDLTAYPKEDRIVGITLFDMMLWTLNQKG